MLTVGYITFISDVKLEKLENLACRLLDYLGCERLRAIIQDYTIGIVLFILVDSFYTYGYVRIRDIVGYGQRGFNSELSSVT